MNSRRGGEDGEVMGHTSRGTGWELKQSWYFLFFFTVYLYWLPLVYTGLRVLQVRWIFYGLLYAAPGAVYLLLAAMGAPPEGSPDFAAAMHDQALRHARNATGAFAIFSFIHAWIARGEFLVRLADQASDVEDMKEQMRERTLTRMGAQSQQGEAEAVPPAPRRLLNVNQVTEAELAMLPGLGPERAKQALRLREAMGDYLSFQDFAGKMQLTQEAAYRLRPLFEPDSEAVALALPKDDPAYRVLPDGSRVLELNWASAEALGALPGLGPKIARRAVELRDGDGPFKSLEDFRYRLSLPMEAMIKISPYVSVISMSTRPGGGSAAKTGGRIVDV